MPIFIIILFIILLVWLLTRTEPKANGRSRKFPPSSSPVLFKKMENKNKLNNETIVIKPSQLIVIKPSITKQPIRIKVSKSVAIKPSGINTVKITPSKTAYVKPPQRGAWDERGWTKQMVGKNETYSGFYQVGNRKYQGRIEIGRWAKGIRMYIHNPPPQIKKHKHGACFQLVKDGWFVLHWSKAARNVDDAILYMEKVLDESLSKR